MLLPFYRSEGSKEVNKTSRKVTGTGTQHTSYARATAWTKGGHGVPHLASSTPHPQQLPHLICSSLHMGGWGDVPRGPHERQRSGSPESSIYSSLVCTSGGSGQPAGRVQDVKLWEMPDCYHCQIQFPATASAPPPGPWVASICLWAGRGPGRVFLDRAFVERSDFPPEPRLSAPSHFSSSFICCKILIIYKTPSRA